MDFISPKQEHALTMCGFANIGAICYFNSILQALLSCSAFVELAMKYSAHFTEKNNKLGCTLVQLITHMRENPAPDERLTIYNSAQVLQSLVVEMKKQNKTQIFGNSQQSASECFIFLIDCLQVKEIEYLFTVVYKRTIRCGACRHKVTVSDCGVHFEVYHRATTERELCDYLLDNGKAALADYKCEKCGQLGKCRENLRLCRMPTVLVLLFNKYTEESKRHIDPLPATISMPGVGGQLVHEMVATVHHSGGLHGGHYTASVSRLGGKYAVSDSSVAKIADFPRTADIYLALYHYQCTQS